MKYGALLILGLIMHFQSLPKLEELGGFTKTRRSRIHTLIQQRHNFGVASVFE
ncbi:MAG: hypothetical protein F6K26_13985 [Moorea sp. SIO2I5]|nr:hypothetical protein [Moorena sp. SIO2I5]